MASVPRSVKLSPALDEAADLLAARLGYGNRNALIKGLLRYACLAKGNHTTTLPWSRLPLPKQDEIDEHCLALAKRGGERAQVLQKITERVVKGMASEEALAQVAGGGAGGQ